jgi:Cys-tRNA(Pro)/Cys-tRNA(Cys) deacylase
MTPAVKQAKKQKIPFELHHYSHDVHASSFGLEAAEKLAVDARRVFKTLVVSTIINNYEQLAVAIIPVECQLNLKLMAKALNTKKVKMAEAKRVESTTGYVLGGVSPLGQKKLLITVIDRTSELFTTVFVSGGKRGLEIELSAKNLAQMTKATFCQLTSN